MCSKWIGQLSQKLIARVWYTFHKILFSANSIIIIANTLRGPAEVIIRIIGSILPGLHDILPVLWHCGKSTIIVDGIVRVIQAGHVMFVQRTINSDLQDKSLVQPYTMHNNYIIIIWI